MTTFARRRLPKPTPVFDSYWRLGAERQRIFRARLRGASGSLTADPILRRFKFTNAYRASDRTSQYLIRHVIYDSDERDWGDTFFRVMLFKIFNKIETWELLRSQFGEPCAESFSIPSYASVLESAMNRGLRIYSAAYIMPSALNFGARRKHENHLRLLHLMLESGVPEQMASAGSMREAFLSLRSLPSIGSFLAYQLVTDLNYAPHLRYGEDEFVEPGPGALDGMAKCFTDPGELSPDDIVRWTMEIQEQELLARGISFDDLWGRPLQLIDCQNLFCEVDKYARVAHPEVKGRSGRSRIKQRFRPRPEPLTAWYPPKWRINDRIHGWLSSPRTDDLKETESADDEDQASWPLTHRQ